MLVFSLLLLAVTIVVLVVRFLQPQRGVQFGTHLLMFLGFAVQFLLLLLLVVIAVVLRVRGRLRCGRFTACLSVLAALGLAGQFYAAQTIAVDGSSVP